MMRKLHSQGLTSIRIPGAPINQYRVLQEIKRRGMLTMRVNLLLQARDIANASLLPSKAVTTPPE